MFSATLIRINLKTLLFFTGFGKKHIKRFLSTLLNPDEIGKCNAAREIVRDKSEVKISKCSVFKMFSVHSKTASRRF